MRKFYYNITLRKFTENEQKDVKYKQKKETQKIAKKRQEEQRSDDRH